jgi:glycosyltransferase involved in cell wall biosynthesis
MLLSCDTFESFFEGVLRLDRDRYLSSYRNDFAWYYGKGLLQNGVRPVIYIPSSRYSGRYETDVGIAVRFVRLPRWYAPLRQLWRGMRLTPWTRYAQERLNVALFMDDLQASVHTDAIDLLYVQEYWSGRFDHLVSRLGIPVAAADHGGVSRGMVKQFKPQAFAKAAAIYCQTMDECREVRSYGAMPLLQPNGVDTTFFCPPPTGAARRTNILTVARLVDGHKRTSDLVKALRLLPDRWTLDIVGTGPDRDVLEALALRLGVSDRVTFYGFRSREEVRAYAQSCGVYAMPSANEAICLAVLEAMACGAAVVASRIRAFESIVDDGETGLLYPVGDVPALATAIQAAWQARESLGGKAVESVGLRFDSVKLYRRLAHTLREAAATAKVAA